MNPCKRKDFITKLRKIGFEGPYSGSKHQFMLFNNYRLAIPSNNEFSAHQILFMLKEINQIIDRNISNKDWENL